MMRYDLILIIPVSVVAGIATLIMLGVMIGNIIKMCKYDGLPLYEE